jgi:hypothetical protein
MGMRGCARLISLLAIVLLQPGALPAEPIPVRYREGTNHGFLAVRTLDGKIRAANDLTQTVRENEVVSRLVFRFRDGSVDDETATFSQQNNFRLISDHHVQKGPLFPHPTDVSITATAGPSAGSGKWDDTLHLKKHPAGYCGNEGVLRGGYTEATARETLNRNPGRGQIFRRWRPLQSHAFRPEGGAGWLYRGNRAVW